MVRAGGGNDALLTLQQASCVCKLGAPVPQGTVTYAATWTADHLYLYASLWHVCAHVPDDMSWLLTADDFDEAAEHPAQQQADQQAEDQDAALKFTQSGRQLQVGRLVC